MVNELSGVQFVYWNHTRDFKITSMISNQNWNFITDSHFEIAEFSQYQEFIYLTK